MTQPSIFTSNFIVFLLTLTIFVQQGISLYFIARYPMLYFSQRPFLIALTNIPLLTILFITGHIRPLRN